jgi:beta-glucosidase
MYNTHMNTFRVMAIVLIGVVILGVVYLATQYFSSEETRVVPRNPLYLDSTAEIDERVNDLLSYMTLEEKVGQMALVEKNSVQTLSDISRFGLGALLSGFGGKPEDNSIVGWRQMVGDFMAESKQSRLRIPILYGVDAIHGHSNVPGFTVFPHSIGLGATGDAGLVQEIAHATGEQVKATGINWSYSPTYDMPQDIRWGRVYETFSDDPELVGRLGSAYIAGLQGQNADANERIEVLATPKHFVGAGSMLWNTSSNENFRIDQGVTPKDLQRLKAEYLPPYQQAIEAGALSMMVGLNSWGETKIAANSYLIRTVLKDELGFTGFVVSDWYGVYEISDDDYDSAVTAINAGVDMVMLPFDYKDFVRNIQRAVRTGDIKMHRVDDAVTRILRAKFALGLFDDASVQEPEPTDFEAHAALARKAVAQSAVLLKNDSNLLPIRAEAKTILVAGSAADNIGQQAGAWTVEWQGIDGNWLPGATSILAGIQTVSGPATKIVYRADAQFNTLEQKADIGIAVVGEKPYAEGWGDKQTPRLSEADTQTISRLQAISKKVVVVLVTGRPLIITDQVDGWDALMVVWLPGSEGAGVADVLFGKAAFTGTLPLPWPASISQLPIVTDGTTRDRSTVLYERYFGLP